MTGEPKKPCALIWRGGGIRARAIAGQPSLDRQAVNPFCSKPI